MPKENPHILVVDHDKVYLEQIAALFHSWGFSFSIYHQGAEAMEAMEHRRFDLILLGLSSSQADSLETAAMIRKREGNPNQPIPIIGLSGSPSSDNDNQALRAGFSLIVHKPVDADKLKGHILSFRRDSENRPNAQAGPFYFSEGFNQKEIEQLYGQDYHHITVMFDLFLKNLPEEIREMEGYLDQGNWKALAATAHKIKPSFRMIGLGTTTKVVSELENLSRSPSDEQQIKCTFIKLKQTVLSILQMVATEKESIETYLSNKTDL